MESIFCSKFFEMKAGKSYLHTWTLHNNCLINIRTYGEEVVSCRACIKMYINMYDTYIPTYLCSGQRIHKSQHFFFFFFFTYIVLKMCGELALEEN